MISVFVTGFSLSFFREGGKPRIRLQDGRHPMSGDFRPMYLLPTPRQKLERLIRHRRLFRKRYWQRWRSNSQTRNFQRLLESLPSKATLNKRSVGRVRLLMEKSA